MIVMSRPYPPSHLPPPSPLFRCRIIINIIIIIVVVLPLLIIIYSKQVRLMLNFSSLFGTYNMSVSTDAWAAVCHVSYCWNRQKKKKASSLSQMPNITNK